MSERSALADIEHLFRPVVVFVVLFLIFLGLRAALTPDDFGVYGHYRAGAIDDNRQYDLVHAGRQACLECHDDVEEAQAGGGHQQIGCEACHGALARHALDPTEVIPERPDPRGLCRVCHDYSGYRPRDFPQVVVKDHAGEDACNECHDPHHPDMD